MFDFSKTEAAKEGSFLKPGVYKMKITKVENGAYDSKIRYLEITFTTSDKLEVRERFNLETKEKDSKFDPLSRLQYLHEAWKNTKLDKKFKDVKELTDYFAKLFANPKAPAKLVTVGGEIDGAKVYARLPFANFVETKGLEEGEFEEGSSEWKKYVKLSSKKSESAGQKNGILNDAEDGKDDDGKDDTDENPW